jgi:hypothetical protein
MLGAAMALPHHCMADGFAASQQLHCHHLFLLLLFYAMIDRDSSWPTEVLVMTLLSRWRRDFEL